MHARRYIHRNEGCHPHRISVDHSDNLHPFPGNAACLVVVINKESRKHLFDHFLEVGRVLANPLRLVMNFTTATQDDPLLNATAANCASSLMLQENHRRDLVLQDMQQELVALIDQIERQQELLEFWEDIFETQAAYMPPSPPPPPPPDPPPALPPTYGLSPLPPPSPMAPIPLSLEESIARGKKQLAEMLARQDELIELTTNIVPSRTMTRGRSIDAAPDPWQDENGEACLGAKNKGARELDFCAFWKSEVTPFSFKRCTGQRVGSSARRFLRCTGQSRRGFSGRVPRSSGHWRNMPVGRR